MILKQGVKLTNLQPQILLAIMVVDGIYSKHGKELVITSLDDSKHGSATLHGKGLAFDCRTSYFLNGEPERVVNEIRAKLGTDFDVLFEGDHIHCEYDAK